MKSNKSSSSMNEIFYPGTQVLNANKGKSRETKENAKHGCTFMYTKIR